MARMRDIKATAKKRYDEVLDYHLAHPHLTQSELGEKLGGLTAQRVGQMLKKAKKARAEK